MSEHDYPPPTAPATTELHPTSDEAEVEPPALTWQVVLPAIAVFLLVAGVFGYFLWQLCYSTMHFPDPRHALSPLK